MFNENEDEVAKQMTESAKTDTVNVTCSIRAAEFQKVEPNSIQEIISEQKLGLMEILTEGDSEDNGQQDLQQTLHLQSDLHPSSPASSWLTFPTCL